MLVLWPVQNLESDFNQFPGIMSIAALLKANGFRSEVVPAEVGAVKSRLSSEPKAILAFSSTTVHAAHYLDLNRAVRESTHDVVSVFGGPHPTYFPEVIEEEGVDAVCIGEGEYPMLEMVSAVAGDQDATRLANWWVKANGDIVRNPIRPLISDLDALPIPDHELFHHRAEGRPSQAVVITSRGCPHNCSYCYNHIYRKLYAGKGKVVRRRSVDHVMEELKVVKEAGYPYIRFSDDLFILFPDWVHEFADRYRREIDLPFSCLVRANYVTREVMDSLKSAGCYRVMMGVEAGNDRVRNEVLKRNMSSEDIVNAARIIREAGIRLVTANILAIPTGTVEDDWETLELNIRCRPRFASVSLMHAFPGTEIHEIAENHGLLGDRHSDNITSAGGFAYKSDLYFGDPQMKARIENLHKMFAVAVWFPWLRPVVRRLMELPPNRPFEMFYLLCVNIGTYLLTMPPRVGIPLLRRKLRVAVARIFTRSRSGTGPEAARP